MRVRSICALAVAALAVGTGVQAQTGRISLEGRGGFAVPTGELKDIGAETGLSIGADLMYNLTPRFTLYAGASRDAFGSGISASGVHGGVKLLARRDGTVLPWLSAGLLGQELETADVESGLEFGLEAGVGADLALTDRFSLTPAVRYRRFGADFATVPVDASWFTFALGAHWHLR